MTIIKEIVTLISLLEFTCWLPLQWEVWMKTPPPPPPPSSTVDKNKSELLLLKPQQQDCAGEPRLIEFEEVNFSHRF